MKKNSRNTSSTHAQARCLHGTSNLQNGDRQLCDATSDARNFFLRASQKYKYDNAKKRVTSPVMGSRSVRPDPTASTWPCSRYLCHLVLSVAMFPRFLLRCSRVFSWFHAIIIDYYFFLLWHCIFEVSRNFPPILAEFSRVFTPFHTRFHALSRPFTSDNYR